MESLVGIDVGGTFTDAVMVTGDGQIRVAKAMTAANVHGNTVATNAILERKGADVGLITTEGFRDVLEFQRQERRNIWDLFAEKPEPLVPRRRRFEVLERMMATGTPRLALDLQSARASIARLKEEGCTAIAICLINSYA